MLYHGDTNILYVSIKEVWIQRRYTYVVCFTGLFTTFVFACPALKSKKEPGLGPLDQKQRSRDSILKFELY